MFKKIALLSDIHGNIAALEAVVNDMKQRNVDQVVNLGDHISGPLWPKETIQFLMRQNWVHLLGNHDRNLIHKDPDEQGPSDAYSYRALVDSEIRWLESLPSSAELCGMLLCHGIPSDDNIYLLETVENGRARLSTRAEIEKRLGRPKPKIVLCGHSHIPRIVEIPGSMIVSPGSVGLQAYDDEQPEYHLMETGSPHARYSIIEYESKIQSVAEILVSYDYDLAAKQALMNHRPDWARGLKSGFFSQ